VFVATTVLLMIATPLLAVAGRRLATTGRRPAPAAPVPAAPVEDAPRDHAVLIGHGEASVALAVELRARGVDVVMTTLSPGGATEAEAAGIPVVRGDARHAHVLTEAGVPAARIVVIAEDTSEEVARSAAVVRSLTGAPVVVRPSDAADLAELAATGVDHVVDPGLSTRWRLVRTVLERLDVAADPGPGQAGRTWADTTRLVDVHWPDDTGCPHGAAVRAVLPQSAACLACLRAGETWVHLRVCLSCGHVGCCDSSPGRHARAHHEESDHPIAASVEPGEHWAYCFLDDTTVTDPGARDAARAAS
jgi:CPA2 family monovalent cation:H+ antiporter-2